MKPLVLCILDGIGIRKGKHGNAVRAAKMPNFDKLMKKYPHSLLEASEENVGLPHGQMGNSEVGHSNIGAGRIVYQPQQLINEEIKNGNLFNNKNILEVINHTKDNNSKLHIFGLLSDGGIHSDINHLMAIIDMCKNNNINNLYFHIFTDGRDTLPTEAIKYIEQLERKITDTKIGKIATISGRYYAMDRDNRWERIEESYKVIIGNAKPVKDYKKYINDNYKNNITDEFIKPILVDKNGIIEDNDGLIVFNYRPDRLRELFKAITNTSFNEFEHKNFNNIKLVTMFGVSEEVICTNAYQKEELENTLGVYLSKKGYKQLRIAETEKYAHVTYFFDGGKELELKGKKQILIPSPKVATYDLKPEMSAYEITDKLLEEIDKYDVVILNYANGDMVGHTGKFDETVKALEHLDVCLGKLYNKVRELNGTLIVTADHGNSDTMLDENNNPVTSHSMSKVPFIITNRNIKLKNGKLSDIAPTILHLLNEKIPNEMNGNVLIKKRKKISNIFITISLIFLFSLCFIYGGRFIKYYSEEHQDIQNKEIMLSDYLIKDITNTGDGLYYQNKEYIFKGNVENNYLIYSGILFRIVKINEDKSIKLVTNESLVNMKLDTDYKESYIRDYLNNQFYKLLTNKEYLKEKIFCYDNNVNNNFSCDNSVIDSVGILNYKDYVEALGNNSYLNINEYFWLMDGNYIFSEGGISSEIIGYYGIRPVINLSENTKLISGDGTINNPYIIDDNKISVGKYINYSNLTWKIIEINDDSYKLALSNLLDDEMYYSYTSSNFNINDRKSVAYYLNNDFYKKIDNTYLLKKYFDLGDNNTIELNVGMMNIFDLYVNDLQNYFLITPYGEEMIYKVDTNGRLSIQLIDNKAKIRPVIYISNNIKLSGEGTITNPYVIE